MAPSKRFLRKRNKCFLEWVKYSRVLWDPFHPDHPFTIRRRKAWEHIGAIFQLKMKTAYKIFSFAITMYRQEYLKVKYSEDGSYISRWTYYNCMDFLDPFIEDEYPLLQDDPFGDEQPFAMDELDLSSMDDVDSLGSDDVPIDDLSNMSTDNSDDEHEVLSDDESSIGENMSEPGEVEGDFSDDPASE